MPACLLACLPACLTALAPSSSWSTGLPWAPLDSFVAPSGSPFGSLWLACGLPGIPGVVGVRGSLWLPTGVVVPRKLSPIFNFGVGELLAPLSSGSLWLSLPPFGSLVRGSFWLPLAPSGSLWLPLACLRIPLDSWSSWSTWLLLAPFGSLVTPSGSLWLAADLSLVAY